MLATAQLPQDSLIITAMVMQMLILIIVIVGIWILPSRIPEHDVMRGSDHTQIQTKALLWLVILMLVGTIGALVLTESQAGKLQHLPLKAIVPVLTWSKVAIVVFFANIVLISVIIWITGRAQSPFHPVLFIIPALAIFLNESLYRVLVYVVLCSTSAAILFLTSNDKALRDTNYRYRLSRVFVACSTLFLTVIIGSYQS